MRPASVRTGHSFTDRDFPNRCRTAYGLSDSGVLIGGGTELLCQTPGETATGEPSLAEGEYVNFFTLEL